MKFGVSLALLLAATLPAARLPAADAPLPVEADMINSGKLQGRIVRLRGVVSTVLRDDIDELYNWIIVRTGEGTVRAAIADLEYPYERLCELRDAEVEVDGKVVRFINLRKFMGFQLYVEAADDIRVTKPPPDDPFAVAPLTDETDLHRRTAVACVLARTESHFYVRGTNGMFMTVKPVGEAAAAMPASGELVEISGFPDYDQEYFRLREAVWRPAGTESPLPPESVKTNSIAWLYDWGGRYKANWWLHGRVVCVSGKVVSTNERRKTVQLQEGSAFVSVDLSGFPEIAQLPPVNSEVEATGLCFGDFAGDKSTMEFPSFEGFIIVPRNADGFRIVRPPPWWTEERLRTGLLILAAAMLAVGALAAMLARMLSRRVRQLTEERLTSARAELKVEERNRLAEELHDAISQTLTGVALQLDAAAGNDGRTQEHVKTARNILEACREELRACLWNLRSRTFDEKDMTEAVLRSLTPAFGAERLSVRFNVPRENLSERQLDAILKILRELAANAFRHGNAKKAVIAGEMHGETISFSVTDDGEGFDMAAAPGPAQGHFGLQGVRERLRHYSGKLDIVSRPGGGCRCVVKMVAAGTE